MGKKKVYSATLYVVRHIENDGSEWLEAKDDPKELDLPQGGKVEIAIYGIERVTDAEWRFDIKE